jgi:hypothetical protein
VYADRVYRSLAGITGGVLLLALAVWLGVDAFVNGTLREALFALGGLLVGVPLVVAFTLRPAVYANDDRMRVRNPFRTVTLPWASVETVQARMSSEVVTTAGAKYQVWAIPVSLRHRKQANRNALKAAAGKADAGPLRVGADQHIAELRELAELGAKRPGAQGEPVVRWAYELGGPVVAGVVLLLVLIIAG